MTSFWDMNPSEPSNGTPTAAECSESAPQRDGSPTCGCTKETSGCSIHPNTRDEWIASMQASLVLILAALEIKPESAKAREADFIEKCSELLTLFDHDTCIWRTSQRSFLTNSLEPFSETWPRAGMMRAGRVYRHRQPVPRTTVIGGGALRNVPTPNACKAANDVALKRSGDGRQKPNKLGWWVAMCPTPTEPLSHMMWQTPIADDAIARKKGKWNSRGEPKLSAEVLMWPTPQHRDYRMGDAPDSKRAIRKREEKFSMNLNDAARMWPTPSATDYKGSVTQSLVMERLEHPRGVRLPEELVRRGETGGQLNPDWTEWLMGFPIGHTALKPSATPKSRSKPRLRGKS